MYLISFATELQKTMQPLQKRISSGYSRGRFQLPRHRGLVVLMSASELSAAEVRVPICKIAKTIVSRPWSKAVNQTNATRLKLTMPVRSWFASTRVSTVKNKNPKKAKPRYQPRYQPKSTNFKHGCLCTVLP